MGGDGNDGMMKRLCGLAEMNSSEEEFRDAVCYGIVNDLSGKLL